MLDKLGYRGVFVMNKEAVVRGRTHGQSNLREVIKIPMADRVEISQTVSGPVHSTASRGTEQLARAVADRVWAERTVTWGSR